MDRNPRQHVRRRTAAIARLHSMTTGAAIVGVAGTAAFGAVAAATWSGDPNATSATGTQATGPSGAATARPAPAATPRAGTGQQVPPAASGTTPNGG
ncbi:MAG TPA: hypothetical protein VGO64_07105, partial [Candidatus Limnocylindrales bacterium]|nr:hypothetical protein [Candidatus Limnocylindrales bacterium]